MLPRGQDLTAAPVSEICPVLPGAAQISRFEQALSPGWHQDPGPRQLASPGFGLPEHGAANQVRLLGESAGVFEGDPTWQVPTQLAPPPDPQVPDENPAALTNSRVTSCASRVPPLRQSPLGN